MQHATWKHPHQIDRQILANAGNRYSPARNCHWISGNFKVTIIASADSNIIAIKRSPLSKTCRP
jgi:hypothetical protein